MVEPLSDDMIAVTRIFCAHLSQVPHLSCVKQK
jgi:hypothetical protein